MAAKAMETAAATRNQWVFPEAFLELGAFMTWPVMGNARFAQVINGSEKFARKNPGIANLPNTLRRSGQPYGLAPRKNIPGIALVQKG